MVAIVEAIEIMIEVMMILVEVIAEVTVIVGSFLAR
jgi:hypothetical protein